MSMHTMMSAGMVVAATGCGLVTDSAHQAVLDPLSPATDLNIVRPPPTCSDHETGCLPPPTCSDHATGCLQTPKCPDPKTDCTHTNGTGVYTDEGGHATVRFKDRTTPALITSFVNIRYTDGDSAVGFLARYDRPDNNPPHDWVAGFVESATYGDVTGLRVLRVSEQGTAPTWTLRYNAQPSFSVSFEQLRDLELTLTPLPPFNPPPFNPTPVVLKFDSHTVFPGANSIGNIPNTSPTPPIIHAYNMVWRQPPNGLYEQYCFNGSRNNDSVVFMQGIQVDPVTGAVSRDPDHVTLSCFLGAPATAHRWGYLYSSNSASHDYLFGAAIQMKRASYCADSEAFTVGGTHIRIRDTAPVPVNNDLIAPDSRLEAWWAPTGALCLGTDEGTNPRYPMLPFSGLCGDTPLSGCLSDLQPGIANYLR